MGQQQQQAAAGAVAAAAASIDDSTIASCMGAARNITVCWATIPT